jgi:E3 ubiquitin-protein ligase UBR1
MVQQIRDHRWKRNGRDIRDQVDWYLDGTRRDVGFDLEFVILQSALCFMGPLKFVRTAIMKFQLDRFFQEHENPLELWLHRTTAAPIVISSVLEDFLWMIIWLVTDTDQVMHRSTQELATQSFIQYLAIGPHTYLDLSRIVPDRVNERIDISAILREVADFRGPTETTSGVYSLKPEFYKEVDILWRHYSRNQRASVIPIASKEIFKWVSQEKPSLDVAKWFLKPRLPQVPPASQGFSNLTEIFHGGIAARIAHYIVMHCMLMDDETAFAKVKNEDLPRLDQLFDLVLHFSTIAIGINRPAFTGEAILGSPFECPETVDKANSLLQNLWYVYVSDKPVWAPYLLRVEYILRSMVKLITKADPTIQDEFDQTNKARGKRFRTTAPVPDGKFKDAGAARQKQVLAEFAKKQAAFAALMAEGDDEDEDMDAPEVQANDNTSFGPCLVCQNPVTADDIGGLLALFQPSRIVREVHGGQEYFEKSLTVHSNLDDAVPHNAPGVWTKETDHESFQKTDAHPSSDHRFGVYVSTCGHLMHEACLLGYTDQTMMRHTHQPARNQPENAQRGEFVCPFCHSVGNFLLPIDFVGPNQNPTFRVDSNGCPIPLLDHIRAISQEGLKGVNDSSKVWQNHDHDGRLKCWFSEGEFQRAMHTRKTRKKDMRGLHRLIDTFRSLFRAVGDQSTMLRESSLPMYLPEDLVGYTVSVLEIQQRGIARGPGQQTVVDQVPETARKLVKKLIEEMRLELDGCFGIQDTRPALRVCLFARFLPDWYRASALAMPLLARDPLSMVIECAAIAPDLLHPVIIMSYYAEVCRALLAIASILRRCVSSWHLQDAPESKNPFTFYHDPHGESAKTIFGDFTGTAAKLLRDAAPYNDINLVLSSAPPPLLAKLLYMYTLPFLRRAAIVFYTIHGSYPMQDTSAHLDDGCEYSRLASRMHIPSLKSVLEERTSPEAQMVSRWLTHWSVAGRHVPQIDVAEPYELLSLPTTHSDMIVYQHLKKCLVCRRVPANPALCLLCGTLVCLAGDCCAEAEQGECNIHMRQYVPCESRELTE